MPYLATLFVEKLSVKRRNMQEQDIDLSSSLVCNPFDVPEIPWIFLNFLLLPTPIFILLRALKCLLKRSYCTSNDLRAKYERNC